MIWGVVVQEDYLGLIVGGRGTSPGVVSGKISWGDCLGAVIQGELSLNPLLLIRYNEEKYFTIFLRRNIIDNR